MILKYKKLNSWVYKPVKNVAIAKVDISEVISKYLNKETGKLEINIDNFCKAGNDVFSIITSNIDIGGYGYSVESLAKFMEHTYYVVVKDNDENAANDNPIYIYTEAYLMTDDGKTIEKLL